MCVTYYLLFYDINFWLLAYVTFHSCPHKLSSYILLVNFSILITFYALHNKAFIIDNSSPFAVCPTWISPQTKCIGLRQQIETTCHWHQEWMCQNVSFTELIVLLCIYDPLNMMVIALLWDLCTRLIEGGRCK